MFVKEFIFSSLLLAFAGMLMTIGTVLLLDGLRRFAIDAYKVIRPNSKSAPAVASTLATVKKPKEKPPTLKEAA